MSSTVVIIDAFLTETENLEGSNDMVEMWRALMTTVRENEESVNKTLTIEG